MHHCVLVSMTGCMLCVCPVRSSTNQEQRPVPPMWSRETQPGLALLPVITQTAAQHNGQQLYCGIFISRFWDIFVKFLWPKIERVFSSSIIEENIEKCRYFQWILIKMSFNLLVRLHNLDTYGYILTGTNMVVYHFPFRVLIQCLSNTRIV